MYNENELVTILKSHSPYFNNKEVYELVSIQKIITLLNKYSQQLAELPVDILFKKIGDLTVSKLYYTLFNNLTELIYILSESKPDKIYLKCISIIDISLSYINTAISNI